MTFLAEAPYALLLGSSVLLGLYLCNRALDAGMPGYESRKIGHLVAGFAYLLAPFVFDTMWWPFIISGGFTVLLLGARVVKPTAFRGVGGVARPHALAEIWFPLSSTIVLGVGWGIFNLPYVAAACILMMAWGDMVTGLVRSRIYGHEVKGNWGSLAMLLMCLLLAWAFIRPLEVGVLVAVAATLTERFMPLSRGFWDDNWAIPLVALAVALGGQYLVRA